MTCLALFVANFLQTTRICWLDQLDLTGVRQDWGKPKSCKTVGDLPLLLNGIRYQRGVGTHANSSFRIDLNGGASSFNAVVGVGDNSSGPTTSIVYKVIVDGKTVVETPVMRQGSGPQKLAVDLRGARSLELVVTDAADGSQYDHAAWYDAHIGVTETGTFPKAASKYTMPPPQDMSLASSPPLTFKCLFVVASDDDGTNRHTSDYGRKPGLESVEDCKRFVNEINEVFRCINVRLVFDAATSYVKRNSTALNRDFDSSLNGASYEIPESVLTNANQIPPKPKLEAFDLAKRALASEFPDRFIFLLMDSALWQFNNQKKRWEVVTGSGGLSGPVTRIAGANSSVMIHELGHNLGLPHTFKPIPQTVEEFQNLIQQELSAGRSLDQALQIFDGDKISDTPIDPGRALLSVLGYKPYEKSHSYKVLVKNEKGNPTELPLDPDVYNWMSYYRECRGNHPSTQLVEGRFTIGQCKVMRQAAMQRSQRLAHKSWLPVFKAAEENRLNEVARLANAAHIVNENAQYLRIATSWAKTVKRQPPSNVDPSEVTMWLSDALPRNAEVGHGSLLYDRSAFSPTISAFLTVQSKVYEHGIYAHAPSKVVYDLNSKWKSFKVKCGIQDGDSKSGSVVFKVFGDGRLLAETRTVGQNQLEELSVDVRNVKSLILVSEDAGDGKTYDWSLWIEPQLYR